MAPTAPNRSIILTPETLLKLTNDLSSYHIRVYAALLTLVTAEKRDCVPARGVLELKTGFSSREVRRCLLRLEAAGWVRREAKRGSRPRITLLGIPTVRERPRTPDDDAVVAVVLGAWRECWQARYRVRPAAELNQERIAREIGALLYALGPREAENLIRQAFAQIRDVPDLAAILALLRD